VRAGDVEKALDDARSRGVEPAAADLLYVYRDRITLLDEARGPRQPNGGAESGSIPPDLRATALALLIARRADRLDYVQSFRREVLRGRLLKADKTEGWIRRQANGDGEPTVHVRPAVADLGPELIREMLRYRDAEDRPRSIPVRADGKLGRLKRVAEELVREFPVWPESDAVHFVLTGEMPPPLLARWTVRRHRDFPAMDSIVIEASPRVSLNDFSTFYRDARTQLIGEGERSRAVVSEDRLSLGLFADANNDGRFRTWREAMDAWRAENPEQQRYRDDEVKRFARDCAAGYKAITGTRFVWGEAQHDEPAEPSEIRDAIELDEEGRMQLRSPDDKTGE
jgi:hypothetical protein